MSKKTLSTDLSRIRNYVLAKQVDFLRAEEVAAELNINVRRVEHCFHFLNLEGLLSQAKHVVCYDRKDKIKRKKINGKWKIIAYIRGVSKCWHPDVYYKKEPKK